MLDEYVTAPEPISMAYFINPSQQSVCLLIIARQCLAKHVPMTIVELLDIIFYAIHLISRKKKRCLALPRTFSY
jgi:hypothetical protein